MNCNIIIAPLIFIMFRRSSRRVLCAFVFSVSEIPGWERDWSGTLGSGDPASSCSGGWVVQVTCFLLDGECRIGVGWRGCRWGLVCFTRHETHTHLEALCLCRVVSIPLSLVSCLSRLLSLVCPVLFLLCFCPLCALSCLCLSFVRLCVCVCLHVCLRLSLACPCLCVLVRKY